MQKVNIFSDAWCEIVFDGEISEQMYIDAGVTLDNVEKNEIQIHSERLAREYADEFAHDLEMLVFKYITKI